MLTLGIDPSSKTSYGALYDGERIVCAGPFWGVGERSGEVLVGKMWCHLHELEAVVVETIELHSGIYKDKSGHVVRSRGANVIATDRAGWKIVEVMKAAGVRVWCPTRRQILKDAGLSNHLADKSVLRHLELLGHLKTREDKRGVLKVAEPACLGTPDARDAAMCAIWNWRSPVNGEWENLK